MFPVTPNCTGQTQCGPRVPQVSVKNQFIDILSLVGPTVPMAVTPPPCCDIEDPRDNFEMNKSGCDITEICKNGHGCLCQGAWGFCGAPVLVWLSFVNPRHSHKDEDSSGISDLWQVTRQSFGVAEL